MLRKINVLWMVLGLAWAPIAHGGKEVSGIPPKTTPPSTYPMAKEVLGAQKLEGQVLLDRLVLSGGGRDLELQPLGAGVRKKHLFLVKVDVYVAQLLGSDLTNFNKLDSESALNSLVFSSGMAMRMTFLRTVSADKMEESFRSACEANGVDPSKGSFVPFLATVKQGVAMKKGDSILVWGVKESGKDVIYYQVGGKTSRVDGEPGFLRQVFSLWMGKPVDRGMENLQKEILGKK